MKIASEKYRVLASCPSFGDAAGGVLTRRRQPSTSLTSASFWEPSIAAEFMTDMCPVAVRAGTRCHRAPSDRIMASP